MASQNSSSTIRSFIAIDLSESIHQEIAQVISTLSQQLMQQSSQIEKAVRWIPKNNIHITLHFLGDVKKSIIEEINKQLNLTISQIPSFNIQIGGLGVFPKPAKPRVIWVGIHPSKELEELYQEISNTINRFGLRTDNRQFQGHITIARVKEADSRIHKAISSTIVQLNNELSYNIIEMKVHQVHFYKSVLKPSGAEYEILSTHYLASNKSL